MTPFTLVWNQLMSVAVFAGILSGIIIIFALLSPRSNFGRSVLGFVHKNILAIGFFVSFAALASSLVYSEIIGYPPCLLCWYARIAFYPQVIMFAIALFKRDRGVEKYAIGLTVFGLVVATYHTIVQIVGESPLPCSSTGVSCVTRFVYEYGFISIPLMGLVGFAFLFLALLASKKAAKQAS